ncbi:acetyltransferase [Butyrivibrio sp. INlla21]|uniref:acetyltransferase n=1 Tax=Butyrivibrio sp. INlla21 TaxID=1520811 RepID=UPI0008E2E9D4|nr:acetyltransferase [Butyrivibrio sp. INlla21]SFV02714.1 sugar O-acyltransferase, sialic acid O-acetyltransferase NeuD family [Butyrivibrio sp. INlla21]
MSKILLVGGGGHCKSVLDSLLSLNAYSEIGIIDSNVGDRIMGISVIGCDDDLPKLIEQGWTDAFVTVGSIGNTKVRHRLYDMLKSIGFNTPSIVDPTAIIAKDVVIDDGTFIGKGAIVNAETRIGCCSIINSGAIIEHECVIGAFCHISTGATLCGQVTISDDTHIGAGTVIRQCIEIGSNSLVGCGSVVVNNIPSNVKAYGNPCKVVM